MMRPTWNSRQVRRAVLRAKRKGRAKRARWIGRNTVLTSRGNDYRSGR